MFTKAVPSITGHVAQPSRNVSPWTTILFPEKNLKKENLERNGINSIEAISYQLKNGKNGMPAFGGKLKEEEIKKIANYIIEKGEKDFE